MKNRIKVVNTFLLECLIIFLPLCISYIILGIWLSAVTDFGRAYIIPSGVTEFREIYGSVVRQAFIEFDSFGPEFKNYSFEVSHIYWSGLISAIFLVLIGKLIYIWLVKLLENRVNIKQ